MVCRGRWRRLRGRRFGAEHASRVPARRERRGGRRPGARNTGVAGWSQGPSSPSRARRAGRSAMRRWRPLAPTRRDGRTGVPRGSRWPIASARVSDRPCGAASFVGRRGTLFAGEGGPSIGPTELAPASPLRVSRAGVSPAGRRVAFRAAGARSVERIEPCLKRCRARGLCAPRSEVTESARSPPVQGGLSRTPRRRNETRPASPLAQRRHARSVTLPRSEHPQRFPAATGGNVRR
jgi:hypothetical protein